MNLLIWAATIRTKAFGERLQALAAAGAKEMSLFPIDFRHFTSSGVSPDEMRTQMADLDIRVSVIDPLATWLPASVPPKGTSQEDLAFTQFTETEVFDMAESLGAESINAIESFGAKVEVEEIAGSFAALCDRARNRGLNVSLEFMPFSAIPDLETAWKVVHLAGRDNGGITFDTWHYFRGTPNDKLLAGIPGNKIHRVQIADARKQMQGSMMEDLLHHRLTPGEGEFELIPLLTILDRIGALKSVGPEIFSDAYDRMDTATAVRRALESCTALLRKAGTKPREVALQAWNHLAAGHKTGNFEPYLVMLADDYSFSMPIGKFRGVHVGREEAIRCYREITASNPDLTYGPPIRISQNGATVVIEFDDSGTIMGQPYQNRIANSFDVRGESICGFREYFGDVDPDFIASVSQSPSHPDN